MRRILKAAVFAVSTAFATISNAAEPAPDEPKIQVAVLLDTSGSMDGLINQTREQLWKIVNTLATAKRDGKRPRIEIALYDYGNDSNPSSNDYVRQVVPLTTDLDKVSEALFALRTNGGSEYCGAVIAHATKELTWSKNSRDLKLIYIAGNEPFTQGPTKFESSVKAAIAQGIVVNTIHAGDEASGISGQWQAAAKLADGNYLFIDQNRAIARVNAPQDVELAQLSQKLNDTYIAFGSAGSAGAARQETQDKNAKGLSASTVAMRAVSKASGAYDNSAWDLVDAKKKGVPVATIAVAALPAPMKDMAPAEREAYVEQKSKERSDLQAHIAKLSVDREAYVAAEVKKQAAAGPTAKTMDDALLESAQEQARKKAFSF